MRAVYVGIPSAPSHWSRFPRSSADWITAAKDRLHNDDKAYPTLLGATSWVTFHGEVVKNTDCSSTEQVYKPLCRIYNCSTSSLCEDLRMQPEAVNCKSFKSLYLTLDYHSCYRELEATALQHCVKLFSDTGAKY